jgi:peptidoglycan/xylan/chitin deacetylase (PgdA/CDA1 family)
MNNLTNREIQLINNITKRTKEVGLGTKLSEVISNMGKVNDTESGNILDSFSFTDWNDVAGASVEQSLEHVRPGTRHTLKQIVTAANTQGRMRRVYPQIDLTEMKQVDYKFYIPDLSKVQWISFAWATAADYNARVELKYYSPYYATDGSKMSLEEEWNHIKIPKEFFETKTTGVPDWNVALNHYIIVMPSTNDPCTVYWSEVGINRFKKDYASLCFDDGFVGVYNNIYPWLLEQGIPFNLFMPKHRINTSGYLTTENINEMVASGLMDVCNHSVNEPSNLHLASPETQTAEYMGCKNWIIESGWNKNGSADIFATPGSGRCWDMAMLNRLKSLGCFAARTNRNFIANAEEPGNPLSLAGYSLSYTTQLADVITYARCAKGGSLVIPYGHDPQPVANSGLQVPVSLIKNIVSNLKSMGYTFTTLANWSKTTL